MEYQTDTLKVYKHHQHARLQKEGEDTWISSEDLRTEGSSDEETQTSDHRGRRTKKHQKQRQSAVLDSAKITSTSASTSSYRATEDYVKDLRACASEIEKSAVETNIDVNPRRFSILDSPMFTDIFTDGACGPSGISLGSSDADMDALNLESRWRPKRGSLKYPILVEGQTTTNYFNEVDGFFNEMMSKLKGLRSCSIIENFELNDIEEENPKMFKYLKNTPSVKKKLKYIKQLDDEIKEVIEVYKSEKAERLKVQNKMCNEICKNNAFPERNTRLFLEMCQFEKSENLDNTDAKECTDSTETVNTNQKDKCDFDDNFIKRNIELAGKGIMAGCSLTDEEKRKLEELLADEQDDSNNPESNLFKYETGYNYDPDDISSDEENFLLANAFSINDDEKSKMDIINSELEKFTMDETEKEKVERSESKRRQTEWKDIVLMDQRLKKINAKLEELRIRNDQDVEDSVERTSDETDSCVSLNSESWSEEAGNGDGNGTGDPEISQQNGE